MRLYNTMTRRKEEFVPLKDGKVGMYTCGPTVYDYAHIGNFRSYVFADILKRFLKLKGFKVDHVMNITDVDDKLIKKTKEEKASLKEITDFYLDAFMDDMESIGIDMDYKRIPRATESIEGMVGIIKTLLDKGLAYRKDDGIYFDISKLDGYGELAGLDLNSLKAGARVDQDEYDKDDAHDFALWKLYRESDGDVYWETDLGKGRPGWHIECSAMSMSNLGENIDIHTGGVDLIFPHHTNEIAQSEGSTGERFVNYWVHCEHLMVDGKKMAKSAGNFYTLRDLIEKGYGYRTIRFFLLSSHYRSQVNLTLDALDAARNGLERIDEFVYNLSHQDGEDNENVTQTTTAFLRRWEEFMEDDLNTPEAVAFMFDYIKSINKEISEGISERNAKDVMDAMRKVDEVFSILPEERELPEDAKELIEKRKEARANKNFEESDRLRNELESMGIEVKDEKEKSYYRVK